MVPVIEVDLVLETVPHAEVVGDIDTVDDTENDGDAVPDLVPVTQLVGERDAVLEKQDVDVCDRV